MVRSNAQAAFEDVALWHERDISHSSVERIILPDSTILVDYMLSKTEWLIGGPFVLTPARMQKNLELYEGSGIFGPAPSRPDGCGDAS